MQKLHLVFSDVKPVTVNHAYYHKNNRKILNKKARDYRASLWKELNDKHTTNFIKLFSKSFNPLKHSLELKLDVLVPENFFYTKDGYVSRRSIDIDNIQKLFVDFTMNKKYQEKDGVCTLGIDDQFLTKITTAKSPYKEDVGEDNTWEIVATYKIVDLKRRK